MAAPGTSSGTYGFSLSNGEIVFEAFDRIQVRPAEITRHHLVSARNSINLELLTWTNDGAPLWEIVAGTIPLVPNQATYTLPVNLVTLLEVNYTQVNANGTGENIDRIMSPLTRTEYAMVPNKKQPGTPTRYWFQMLAAPLITLWQNPMIGAPTWIITYYALQRIQDADFATGQTPDVLYRGLDALCAALAFRLCEKFGPQDPLGRKTMMEEKKTLADVAWANFATRDQEAGPMLIQPNIGVYSKIW